MAATYFFQLLGAITKTRAISCWFVQMSFCHCKFGDKKLATLNTFVHHALSVDERVPCFFKDFEHVNLSSHLDRFQDAAVPFDGTESVYGSSSSLQSSL